MRLDRFLWWVRIVKTREFAQGMAQAGRLRIDGRAVERAAAPVRVGNVLTFATHRGEVRVIRVEALPARRGPPAEARACYQDLDSDPLTRMGAGRCRPDPASLDQQPNAANDSQESAGD